MRTINGIIIDTYLGISPIGRFTFKISVKCERKIVTIGEYIMDEKGENGEFKIPNKTLDIILQIMGVIGVERWEDLKGKYVRINDNEWGETSEIIGNIVEDKWYNVTEDIKRKKES